MVALLADAVVASVEPSVRAVVVIIVSVKIGVGEIAVVHRFVRVLGVQVSHAHGVSVDRTALTPRRTRHTVQQIGHIAQLLICTTTLLQIVTATVGLLLVVSGYVRDCS